MPNSNPEQKNYAEIERLEKLLGELRDNRSTARETEAIREIGLEIALAVREVGAMLVNVGWEQAGTAPGGNAGELPRPGVERPPHPALRVPRGGAVGPP